MVRTELETLSSMMSEQIRDSRRRAVRARCRKTSALNELRRIEGMKSYSRCIHLTNDEALAGYSRGFTA